MSPISSKPTPVLDGSAAGFRRAAGDLGEAIAVLSGGFAEPGGPVERITDLAIAAAERHFARRVAAVRKAIEAAEDFDAAARAVLEIGASWTPDALGLHAGRSVGARPCAVGAPQ